jgi:hypothetical protein
MPESVDCRMVAHCIAHKLSYENPEQRQKRITGQAQRQGLIAGIGAVPADEKQQVQA